MANSYFNQNSNTVPVTSAANLAAAANNPQISPMQMQIPQTLFPQPNGSVYNLNTAREIGNIPAGLGISIGLCLPESIMYIKALQNGAPMILGYRLTPLENNTETPIQPVAAAPTSASAAVENTTSNNNEISKDLKKVIETLQSYDEKFIKLEEQIAKLKKNGGKQEWQL